MGKEMRKNILIVDDEQLIRQGFLARMEYLKIERDEVFEAASGREALEIVRQHPVDIVVTDIRMPDLDGLTLIRLAREIRKEIRFVVLSGYAEFSYAESAIQLGVREYLLKPLSNEALKRTFDKLYEEMEQSSRMQESLRREQRLSLEQREYRQEREINALVSNLSDREVGPEQLRRAMRPEEETDGTGETAGMGEDPAVAGESLTGAERNPGGTGEAPAAALALVSVELEQVENHGFSGEDHELIRFSVRNVFHEIPGDCEKVIVNCLSDYWLLYALFLGDGEKRLREEISRIYGRMSLVLKKIGVAVSVGVSGIGPRLTGRSRQEAESALQQRVAYGSGLYFYEEHKPELRFPDTQVKLLGQYLESGELERIPELLSCIFSEEMARRYGTSYLQFMWISSLNQVFHYYSRQNEGSAGMDRLMKSFFSQDRVRTVEELREKLWQIISECVEAEQLPAAGLSSRIRMAEQYIRNHYEENLTVADLAERFGMSPNYFSFAFKKELNCSAVSCLTNVRLQKAKELLTGSDLSAADIAQRVGYRESQYFFRVFKRNTGMTPLQYRERARERREK